MRGTSESFHIGAEFRRKRVGIVGPPVVDAGRVHQVQEALLLGKQQFQLSRSIVGRVEQRIEHMEESAQEAIKSLPLRLQGVILVTQEVPAQLSCPGITFRPPRMPPPGCKLIRS